MSGDPKRCRERALECRYLANEANTPQSKEIFSIYRRPGFGWRAELETPTPSCGPSMKWNLRMGWRMATSLPRRQHNRV